MSDIGDPDSLLEQAAERANTAHTIFMLLDSDADGLVSVEQVCQTTPKPPVPRRPARLMRRQASAYPDLEDLPAVAVAPRPPAASAHGPASPPEDLSLPRRSRS